MRDARNVVMRKKREGNFEFLTVIFILAKSTNIQSRTCHFSPYSSSLCARPFYDFADNFRT